MNKSPLELLERMVVGIDSEVYSAFVEEIKKYVGEYPYTNESFDRCRCEIEKMPDGLHFRMRVLSAICGWLAAILAVLVMILWSRSPGFVIGLLIIVALILLSTSMILHAKYVGSWKIRKLDSWVPAWSLKLRIRFPRMHMSCHKFMRDEVVLCKLIVVRNGDEIYCVEDLSESVIMGL